MVSRRNFIKASTLATASMVAGVGKGEAKSLFEKIGKTAPEAQKVKQAGLHRYRQSRGAEHQAIRKDRAGGNNRPV